MDVSVIPFKVLQLKKNRQTQNLRPCRRRGTESNSNNLGQESTNLFLKGPDIFGFVGSVATPLCPHGAKTAIDKMYVNEHGCFPIKLNLQKQVAAGLGPTGYSLIILEQS